MATFVQIEPDAFNQVFAEVATEDNIGAGNGSSSLGNPKTGMYHHVRRPVRGIQIKDETYATIQVRRSNGVAIPLFDAAAKDNTGMGLKNSNFLIQSVSEQRAEKHQVILTFGEPYIFFFGEHPRMINVSGILLNTEDFNWRAEWWENYDRFLRGTQCVRTKTRVYLSWDDIVVEGYITQANAVEDASNRNLVQFSFQLFLTNYQNISNIGNPNAHWEGKEINLNPSAIDIPGQEATSSTDRVRAANLRQQELQTSQNSTSLFEFLRGGPLSNLSSSTINVNGQRVDFLSLASRFVSGRTVRVPIGVSRLANFDIEVQRALSSIPGALNVIDGGEVGRVVTLQTATTGLVSEFRTDVREKFSKALVGQPLSANEDEFIARVQHDENGFTKFGNLFSDQLADQEEAMERVEDTFSRFGIEGGEYNEVTKLVKSSRFGIVSIKGASIVRNITG